MKNVSIFFFSGTGNTWWISVSLQKHLDTLGLEAEVISIESPADHIVKKIKAAEIIFLLYPIYGSDRPEIVKDFISSLPSEDGKHFGIICTQLMFSGDGAWFEHELIEEKGYKIKWAFHVKMPNNISIPGFPFSFTNDKSKLKKTLDKADRRLKMIAENVYNNCSHTQGTSWISGFLGNSQRKPYRKYFSGFQNAVSIDPEKCIKCGICIKLCPAGNILFADSDSSGYPEFQGNCNLCLRCYNFCPEQAVLYQARSFKPKGRGRMVPYRGPVEGFDPEILKNHIKLD